MKRMDRLLWMPTCLLWLAASICSGDDGSLPQYRQTGSFAAPEAHQGVAADRKYVYAVTNRAVAKYGRKTGSLIAVSQGAALHLNSGFLYRGKVLCAHSNYPQQPEQSQIKVLDPRSMQLTVYHDFGNYGGSLTWIVRRGNKWLCNFAKYDELNSETFLVEFDRQWKETGRWTYPPELIAQLGKYSLSGGLFHQNRVFGTGHDEQEIYFLEFPKTGHVLHYLGKTPVPFTGQGFAVDPVGRGLLGISRAEHRVIFTEQIK